MHVVILSLMIKDKAVSLHVVFLRQGIAFRPPIKVAKTPFLSVPVAARSKA